MSRIIPPSLSRLDTIKKVAALIDGTPVGKVSPRSLQIHTVYTIHTTSRYELKKFAIAGRKKAKTVSQSPALFAIFSSRYLHGGVVELRS